MIQLPNKFFNKKICVVENYVPNLLSQEAYLFIITPDHQIDIKTLKVPQSWVEEIVIYLLYPGTLAQYRNDGGKDLYNYYDTLVGFKKYIPFVQLDDAVTKLLNEEKIIITIHRKRFGEDGEFRLKKSFLSKVFIDKPPKKAKIKDLL